MEASKLRSPNGTCYMGLADWRGLSLLPLENNSYMFCDLRGAQFDNLSLSGVTFFACRLDGTSFRGTTLHNVQFIGCFSSEQTPPTDFEGALWLNSDAKGSHLNVAKGSFQDMPSFRCWPAQVVEAANKSLSERNDIRYEAALSLGKLGNPIVTPYLANLLLDREWEVRVATLRALAQLRNQRFPCRDSILLQWLFRSLGDPHILVRQTTSELIKTLRPSDEILRFSLSEQNAFLSAKESSNENKLATLRAARELLKFDQSYSRLLDLKSLQRQLKDDAFEVRQASLSLLALLDEPSTLPWLLQSLSDKHPTVRLAALQAYTWRLSCPPISHIMPLLSDSNEEVRIEALYTLSDAGELRPQHLAQALADLEHHSPELLGVVRKLLLLSDWVARDNQNNDPK